MAKKIEVITVAAPKNVRKNGGYRPAKLGKTEFVAAKYAKLKLTLGKQGKVLVEDHQAGNYKPYEITENDILLGRNQQNNVADSQIVELTQVAKDQELVIAEMQKRIKELESVKGKGAKTKEAVPTSADTEKGATK